MSYNEPKQINAKDFLDDLITRKEAARLLGLKPNSMTRLHNRGTLLLLRYKRGRQILYSRNQLADYIQQGKTLACRLQTRTSTRTEKGEYE